MIYRGQTEDLFQWTVDKVAPQDGVQGLGYLDRNLWLGGIDGDQRRHWHSKTILGLQYSIGLKEIQATQPPQDRVS
jgi:hypothetical protein